MSLPWRLLPFLRASEEQLAAQRTGSAPLLPTGLSSTNPNDDTAQTDAGRLSTAALRATHTHGTHELRVLAQPRGAVEVLAQAPHPLRSVLPAHDRLAVAVGVSGTTILTLGVDETHGTLKTWRFTSGVTEGIECTSVLRFAPEDVPTALAVPAPSDPPSRLVAVGFADGAVTLLRGDLERDRIVRKRVAPAPGEMSESRGVVALAFAGEALFVATETSIAVVHTGGEDRRAVLDTRGARRAALCTLLPVSGQFCVARDEALYFFTRDGRGPCLAFPTKCADGFVGALGRYVLHGAGAGEVVAYDIANKVRVYRGKGDVRSGFTDTEGELLLCMKDGGIRRLVEIGLRERVGMLIGRELHTAAVALARSEADKKELLMYAIRKYAEHLIQDNKFDAAATQLIETIGGGVEPSWVISQLVEQSGLRSGLRLYLEALHGAGRAAFVHTKVLITCYRHDRARAAVLPTTDCTTHDKHLISVMENIDWSENQVDSAIIMCREAALYRVAESLARKRSRHLARANILLYDLDDLPGVMKLLTSLSDDQQVAAILRSVARNLLLKAPAPFVDFLANAVSKSTARAIPGKQPAVRISEFKPLFADRPRLYAVLLDRVLARPGSLLTSDVPATWLDLFESLVCVDVAERVTASLNGHSHESGDSFVSDMDDVRSTHSTMTTTLNTDRISRVGRRALKTLQSRRSMIDLRQALRIAELHGHDPCLEYLYEYLRMYRELGVCLRIHANGKALLRAARRHGEREPMLWLEALRLFTPLACEELLSRESDSPTRISNHDPAHSTPTPWSAPTDRHKPRADRTCADTLQEIVAMLDRSGTLSPVEIVEAASAAAPAAPWTLLTEYFDTRLSALTKRAQHEEYAGMRLDLDLQELRKEATRLGEEAVVIKPHICDACEDPVSIPMIHFFCTHSFHASCLEPSAIRADFGQPVADGMWVEECPQCVPEQDAAVSMRQAIEERNVKHDEFFGKLTASRNGLATIIEYLERSPFI